MPCPSQPLPAALSATKDSAHREAVAAQPLQNHPSYLVIRQYIQRLPARLAVGLAVAERQADGMHLILFLQQRLDVIAHSSAPVPPHIIQPQWTLGLPQLQSLLEVTCSAFRYQRRKVYILNLAHILYNTQSV